MRYRDAAAYAQAIGTLPEGHTRDVLVAFDAWRRHRHDTALRLLGGVLRDDALSLRWVVRARNLRGVVLYEIGLTSEALQCHLEELRDAQTLGDPVAESFALHDLGIVYRFVDPHLARDYYVRAVGLARSYRDRPGAVQRESRYLEALAIVNLRNLQQDAGEPLGIPAELLDLDVAEELVHDVWPELVHALRAERVVLALVRGDLDGADRLAAALPDPSTLRDATNAHSVVIAQARLASHHGEHDRARELLRASLETTPPTFRLEVFDALIDIEERAGDLRAALQAAKDRAVVATAFHAREGQTAVRALEVWFRTREAEDAARAAEAVAERLRERLDAADRDREALLRNSHRDPLTGLWNRSHLLEVFDRLGPGAGHQVAIADVDDFKQINDSLGHGVGDETLVALAEALTRAAGPRDTCARYGGDELVVVRPDAVGGDLAADLAAIARLDLDDERPAVSVSIGVARTTEDEGFVRALDAADRAMYEAKRLGGGRVIVAD